MEHGLRDKYESVKFMKATDVRVMKAGQIKQEIQKISAKDSEARRLEKKEDSLLRRLKETHALQQETLSQIQDVFSDRYLDSSNIEKMEKREKIRARFALKEGQGLDSSIEDLTDEDDIANQMIVEKKKGSSSLKA